MCVIFTIRIRLLQSNHNGTFENSVLWISIALHVNRIVLNIYRSVISKGTNDRTLLELSISLTSIRKRRGPRIDPCGHLYLYLMMLIGSDFTAHCVPGRRGNNNNNNNNNNIIIFYRNKITRYNWQSNKIQMAWLTGWLVVW